jgi:H+-transporting ATPase
LTEAPTVRSDVATEAAEGTDREASPKSSAKELYASFDTGPDGLDDEEAARRLERDGPNALEERRSGVLRRLILYFWVRSH